MQLRPYQRAAVDAVVDAWSAGFHAPVIALPTGAGKTVTAAHLLRGIRDDVGLRSAWLTDREILMEQTRGELEACGTVRCPCAGAAVEDAAGRRDGR